MRLIGAGFGAALGLGAAVPSARAGPVFANAIACGRSAGIGAADCGKAFALAQAEYLAKTRSYPNRFSCYRAYGPCSPWPATGGPTARFRPQFMGMTLEGPATARTVQPVVAAGKVRLALASRALSGPPPTGVAAVAGVPAAPFGGGMATVVLCRLIADGAAKAHLPPAFLARLLWQESSFRAHVVSPAGAQGIAQFMPGTATERGLDDPFDPARAITAAAALLGDLTGRFGNLGLAAAAYNGGPARVAGWLRGRRSLPTETETYVRAITGRAVGDWAAATGSDAVADLRTPCP